MEKRDMSLSG